MDTHMSPEVLEGLKRAKTIALRKSSRLRVVMGDQVLPVLRSWQGGFALDQDAPHLRGTVEFCDGSRVLYECLIVCSALEGSECVYEYKRLTPATETGPVDFVRADDAPIALLERK